METECRKIPRCLLRLSAGLWLISGSAAAFAASNSSNVSVDYGHDAGSNSGSSSFVTSDMSSSGASGVTFTSGTSDMLSSGADPGSSGSGTSDMSSDPNPGPSRCGGIAGGTYAKNWEARKKDFPNICGKNGNVLSLPLWDMLTSEVGTCTKISGLINKGAPGPVTPDQIKQIAGRYQVACNTYRESIKIADVACSEAEMAERAAQRVQQNSSSANGTGVQLVEGLACRVKIISTMYDEASGATLDTIKNFQKALPELQPNKNPVDPKMQSLVDGANAQIRAFVASVRQQASTAMGASAQSGANGAPTPALGQLKFTSQRDVDVFTGALATCEKAAALVEDINWYYQNKVMKQFVAFKAEAEQISSGEKDKAKTAGSLTEEYKRRAAAMVYNDGKPMVVDRGPIATSPSVSSPDALTDAQLKLRQSTLRLSEIDSCSNYAGTGFKVQTKDGSYSDVTAAHVVAGYSMDIDKRSNLLAVPVDSAPGAPKVQENFADKSAYFSHDDDVAYLGHATPGAALSPVDSASATPTPGQEFIVAGTPALKYDGAYVNLNCSYVGGGPNGQLVMDCPTSNTFIGGMSGGPVVDAKTGQVWGLVAQQGTTYTEGNNGYRDNRVFVAPISQDSTGTIVVGATTYYKADTCYETASTILPRPCYVTPLGTSYDSSSETVAR